MSAVPEWSDDEVTVPADPDLEDLIPIFLENRADDVVSIRAALQKGDFETVRILGHNMRGAGGGYGFDVVTRLGKLLETAGKTADPAAATQGVDALELYLKQVRVVYE